MGSPLTAKCPDCAVAPGEVHRSGCDVERCSSCLGQRLSCGCADHDPDKSRWDGEWPGAKECRERGWWCTDGHGPHPRRGAYLPCPPGTPGATEDLNRLTYFHVTGRDGLYTEEEMNFEKGNGR